jgi:hypothetical protein
VATGPADRPDCLLLLPPPPPLLLLLLLLLPVLLLLPPPLLEGCALPRGSCCPDFRPV